MNSMFRLDYTKWDKLAQAGRTKKKSGPGPATGAACKTLVTNYSFFSVSSKDCVPAPPLTSTSAATLL
jgi:hypothetical protein